MNVANVASCKALTSSKLSYYRSEHDFQCFGEFESVDEFCALKEDALRSGRKLLILGNGSNVLFRDREVKSMVLRNRLAPYIEHVEGHLYRVSSSVPMAKVLRFCFENNLDSFYYLASVPATIGGALAMNAGRGRHIGQSIYDFVRSVRYWDGDGLREGAPSDLVQGYRETIFTGVQDKLIVDAVFAFPPTTFEGNPLVARALHVKEVQDNTAPNCGSVFKEWDPFVMRLLQGKGLFQAWYSKKTINWINNESPSTRGIFALIRMARFLHRLKFKKAVLELVVVD